MGPAGELEPSADPGWDEFDHVSMMSKLPAPFEGRQPSKAEFQEWFEAATDRWTNGEYDEEYAEPFGDFTDRVEEALHRLVDQVGSGTAAVFTSGGPIAWACATLLTDEAGGAQAPVAPAEPGLRELRRHPARDRAARRHLRQLQRPRAPRRRTGDAHVSLTARCCGTRRGHQNVSPSSRARAGTSTVRTTRVSSRTPMQITTPS